LTTAVYIVEVREIARTSIATQIAVPARELVNPN